MKINFPLDVVIDIDKVPQNFEELILKSFKEYTRGTSDSYTYQDKLSYIDLCRELLHKAENVESCVQNLMQEYLEYESSVQDEIPEKDDCLSVEFMMDCFEKGRTNLCDQYTGNHHIDDKIMDLLARAVKVVINYEKEPAI